MSIPHETDRTDIADTALPATKFNAALQQIPAKQLLVIIDSCHAQGMASSKEGANNRSPLPKGFTQRHYSTRNGKGRFHLLHRKPIIVDTSRWQNERLYLPSPRSIARCSKPTGG